MAIRHARELARTLHHTVSRLPAEQRPQGELYAAHVDGTMDHQQRARVLSHLAHPPEQGWSVVANARCLGEGVDVPAIDSVLFAAPKTSVIDIVQAAGRALRDHWHDQSG